MLNLPDITLVCVTSVNIEDSQIAIDKSTKYIKFGDVKFITNQKLNNIDEYSKFIVYNLHEYIDTKFCLIIQYDGYVLNPNSWKDEFLEYDYIGAPWCWPKDNFSYRDSFGNVVRVGNGGFSLRSKKILEIPTKMKLPWEPFHGYYNEDGFFTCKNRHIFEECGCKFADIETAKYFSHEADIPEIQGIVPFGFHGKNRL